MIDAEANSARRRAQRRPSSQRGPSHPLPVRPKTSAGDGHERDDAVAQLAGALRTAKRAHRAYLTELRQGDVEAAEDWSTWYAEYLLGLR
jgi:hypothetical protein